MRSAELRKRVKVGVADAPRADELLLALAMTTGPRVHNRADGL
jgi:Amino acid synthesis